MVTMDPIKMEMLLDEQLKLMKLVTSSKSTSETSSTVPVPNSTLSVDGIINSIAEFNYDPEANVTFDTWFRRYEDLFMFDLASQDDSWKVRLLLRKLGAAELDKYCNLILPQNPRDRTFTETCTTLSQHFGDNSSLFNIRYRCLKLKMNESDDFLTHVGIVNRECERFKLKDLSEDQFKSLILICSLQSERFADIRTRLLHRLDQEPTLSLKDIAAEHQRLTNLKHDTTLVQSGGHSEIEVHAVHQKPNPRQLTPATTTPTSCAKPADKKRTIPPSRCWNCGAWHFAKFCPFKNYRCRKCDMLGHKETFCKQKETRTRSRSRRRFRSLSKPAESLSVSTVNHIHQRPARKYVSVQINGQEVSLQLDTASDITIISRETWIKIGKPVLCSTEQLAVSATGNRLQIVGKIVCSVTFNDITMNGVCYVVNSNLNLLGLDWFADLKLGDVPLSTICNRIVNIKDSKDFTKNPPKVEAVTWSDPSSPWSRVHLDFAGPMSGTYYLVLVDAYSKWPEIHPVVPPTTHKTLEILMKLFACHGFPETLVTDNGSQFTSQSFSDFCRKNAITHIRSPPYHPQSNGQAERFVDTFKRAILKAEGEGTLSEVIQRFLLVYRSTPNSSVPQQKSPAEALMGRKLRTINEVMRPAKVENNEDDIYKNGTEVYVRNYRPGSETWRKGVIKGRRGKVIYEVAVEGQIWVRHRNQLRRRFSGEKVDKPNLALEFLLDTFKLPTEKTTVIAASNEKPTLAEEQSLRRSERKRKPTVRFQESELLSKRGGARKRQN
ncbi:hypothetical protein MN116_000030 [Schistosoma mekongi]|uniref:Integrase catalytic domain-containing protein n=1 Tax=Schistosoma mekongi TaxID=38744 RepID=A0AAE2D3P4_SCHME|nr:hypothetical protein MN116_000030 [Schistosoma mekongi]